MQKITGVLLVLAGVAALVWGGFRYTTKEKVIDLGPIQATATREKTVPIPPLLGAAGVLGGLALLVLGKR